ncbi:MAG: hypothetical protein MUP58_03535 [Candidatus Nanohaloarchaeota archaeon QJJ-9]|nr:hypothetical protein [Candidatus Nanohaloarchaeota archaeon QJJ-9]
MSLDLADILKHGFEKVKNSAGLKLIVVYFFVTGLLQIATASFFTVMMEKLFPSMMGASKVQSTLQQQTPLALIDSVAASSLLGILAFLASIILFITAIRTFLEGKEESIPKRFYAEDLLRPGINTAIGGLVVAILVGLGLLAFIVPGIYLGLALMFFTVYIVDKDLNFLDAMKKSWHITKGHKIELFILLIILSAINGAIGFGTGLVSGIFSGNVLQRALVGELIIRGLTTSFTTIFSWAVVVEAYERLEKG